MSGAFLVWRFSHHAAAHWLLSWTVAWQASARELEVALQERGALEIDGCWRVMSGALLGDTLEVLLLTAVQHGWGSCIPVAEAGQVMSSDGFDPRQGQPPFALLEFSSAKGLRGSCTHVVCGTGRKVKLCCEIAGELRKRLSH